MSKNGRPPLYGKWPHPIMWAGSRAAGGKTTITAKPKLPNQCVIFIIYTSFTNVAAERVIQAGGPRIG
jgi:hypothetical protein